MLGVEWMSDYERLRALLARLQALHTDVVAHRRDVNILLGEITVFEKVLRRPLVAADQQRSSSGSGGLEGTPAGQFTEGGIAHPGRVGAARPPVAGPEGGIQAFLAQLGADARDRALALGR